MQSVEINDAIAELAQTPNWVCWNADPSPEGKKSRKVPKNPLTGQNAKVNDPSTWASFETAQAAHARYGCSGIGFVFTNDAGFTGIDLDDCFEPSSTPEAPRNLKPMAEEIVALLDSYTELSPSGNGLHIIVKGVAPQSLKTEEIEIYSSGRYFTVTGRHIAGTPLCIEFRESELREVCSPPGREPSKRAAIAPTNLSSKQEPFSIPSADEIARALRYIPVQTDYNSVWLRVLMAVHSAYPNETGIQLIEEWSPGHAGEVEKKWASFKRRHDTKVITIRTLFFIARQYDYPGSDFKSFAASTVVDSAVHVVPPVEVSERLPLADLELVKSCLHDQELGDAMLFVHIYRGRIVYDHSENHWYIWNGNHWLQDRKGLVALLCAAQVSAQYGRTASILKRNAAALLRTAELAALAEDGESSTERQKAMELRELAASLSKRASKLKTRLGTKNALEYAKSVPEMAVTGESWDTSITSLPVLNGVVDMETGELRAGRPEDYFRTVIPVEWKGLNHPAERWDTFIREIMGNDTELTDFLKRLFGYSASGLTIEHILPILYGEDGRNGKDTLIESIAYALGPLAGSLSKDAIMQKTRGASGAATPHLTPLQGKRLVWSTEPDEDARIDAATVKLITGGGRLRARPLYGNEYEWEPTHTVFLITNPKPNASASDNALWERVLLIPFEQRFVNVPRPDATNEHLVDKHLKQTLRKEASGILAWLVRGFIEWRNSGLNVPTKIRVATQDYRHAQDVLTAFLEDCCDLQQDFECLATP